MIHELRDFARRVVAKATELDEVGVLDDWLQVFVELAKDDDDEDAAQEQSSHLGCDHAASECIPDALNVARAEQASGVPLCSDCDEIMEPCGAIAPYCTFQCPNCGRKVHGTYATQPGTAGREPDATGRREATADRRSIPSSAPAATLDPAIVEECARVYDDAPWVTDGESREQDIASMRAALTHYRERVEKPLREELRLIDEAAYGHHVPEERQVGLLYRVCRLRSSVEQLTDDAAKHVEKMRGQRQHNRDVNRALTIRDAELSTSRAEADRLRAELDRTREELSSATNLLDNWKHDSTVAWAEADRLRGELADVLKQLRHSIAAADAEAREVNRLNAIIRDGAAPQPTDEERQRLADEMRYCAGSSASGLVSVRADDLRKVATLLEEPPRRHARKSLGRRFVLRFEDGEISTRTHYDLHSAEVGASAAGATLIECDLVPVEEGE